MSETISAASLCLLVDSWIAGGKQVAGPYRVKKLNASHAKTYKPDSACADLVLYTRLESAGQLTLTDFLRPSNSIKEFVFPRHENLYAYKYQGKQIELMPVEMPTAEQIIIGARPCDSASLPVLDKVFNWDFHDEFYNRRRELTTVVTLACRHYDAHCFCTTIGLGPEDTRGSDVMLLELDGAGYEVRCLTEKGRRLFDGHTEKSNEQGRAAEGPPERFDLAAVGDFLEDGYERPEWQTVTRRCLGCGACGYTCPTCHCFDIVDQCNHKGGMRVRNWDACQFALFTQHASGHNPRANQGQRQRQRIFHKYQTYPDKFGEVLCTGCGNCSRCCPVGLGVLPVLKSIAEGMNSYQHEDYSQ